MNQYLKNCIELNNIEALSLGKLIAQFEANINSLDKALLVYYKLKQMGFKRTPRATTKTENNALLSFAKRVIESDQLEA